LLKLIWILLVIHYFKNIIQCNLNDSKQIIDEWILTVLCFILILCVIVSNKFRLRILFNTYTTVPITNYSNKEFNLLKKISNEKDAQHMTHNT